MNQDGFKWYVIALSPKKGAHVKLLIESSVALLRIENKFDRFFVLAGYKSGGLFSGGLLSGYALIHCKLCAEIYNIINNTSQVYGFLQFDDHIKELTDEEVVILMTATLHREDEGKYFEAGDGVKIKEGAFKDFRAKLLSMGRNKAYVEINVMGRMIKASIDLVYLEKIR